MTAAVNFNNFNKNFIMNLNKSNLAQNKINAKPSFGESELQEQDSYGYPQREKLSAVKKSAIAIGIGFLSMAVIILAKKGRTSMPVSKKIGSTTAIDSIEELMKNRDTLAGNEGIIDATQLIMAKHGESENHQGVVEEGEKLLNYLSLMKEGRLKPHENSFRTAEVWNNPYYISQERIRTLLIMADSYNSLGKEQKCLDCLNSALDLQTPLK